MGIIHCNLRVLMAERNLNIQNVKDNTSLSRTTISNLYNNYGRGIQFDTLLELCKFLHCTPGDLLTYIQIEPIFTIETDPSEVDMNERIHVINAEGDGHEYISDISTTVKINCDLKYEEKNYNFLFNTKLEFFIDENKQMNTVFIDVDPRDTRDIKNIFIPHAYDFFAEKLADFCVDWGYDYFPEEIEGIGNNIMTHFNFFELDNA